MVRMVIAEPDELLLLRMSGQFSRAEGLEVVGTARDCSSALDLVRSTRPDLVLVDGGLPTVALPILRELLELVEAHKLEAWEPAELVARPMVLLCRCLDALNTEGDTREALFLRACRLDPLQALSVPAPKAPAAGAS